MNDKRYLREISITDDRESREPAMSPPKIREAETVKNNLRETWKAGKEIPEKRQFKKQINHVMRGILLYNILLMVIVMGDLLIRTVKVMLAHPTGPQQEEAVDALMKQMLHSGSSSIAAVLIGTAVLLLYFRKDCLLKPMFAPGGKRPSAGRFVEMICYMMVAQIIFSVMATGVEAAANRFGYSFMGSIEAATGTSSTISMVLYAGIFGPVFEEIIYRGFLMKSLQRYGKTFAILVSAVVFGLMHGNPLQSVFACMAGVIFGYAAMEYSIYVAILLHVINNLLFGDAFTRLLSGLPVGGQQVVYLLVVGGLCAAGCVLAVRHRKRIADYFRRNGSRRQYYLYAFTAVWMILFIVMEIFTMMGGVEKIS